MGSGNVLLANMMRWAWDEIKAGRKSSRSITGATALEVMENCVRVIEESVDNVPDTEDDNPATLNSAIDEDIELMVKEIEDTPDTEDDGRP